MELKTHSTTQYRNALLALLPHGRIWNQERENPHSQLFQLCQVWALEYTQLEAKLKSLSLEASPLTASNTLDDWVKTTGTSLLEGRKPIQRARTIAALTGSQASRKAGLATIAQMMDYKLELQPIYPQSQAIIAPRFGQMHCGQRLWDPSYALHRRLVIRSARPDYQVLKEQVDSQKIAHCGTLQCGKRLWQSNTAIQKITNITLYEIKTIENLMPAQLILTRVLQ